LALYKKCHKFHRGLCKCYSKKKPALPVREYFPDTIVVVLLFISLFQEAESSKSDEDVNNMNSRADDETHIVYTSSVPSQTVNTTLHNP